MTTVRLGKQVYVESFQQVLQYIYTGQVEVAGDRTPLRKLAQALGLKQLAMLASGALPVPGAVYSAFSLVELFTQQAVTISHSAVRCSLQLPSTNAQGCSHEEQHRPSQQHGQNYSSSTSSARVHDSSDSNIVADDGVYSKVHPALEDLSAAVTDSHAPRRLPIPADVPSHADILLVPSQTNAGSLVQQLGHMPQSLPGQRPAYHSKATHHAGGALLPQQTPTANNADAQNSLVGLAAHAAVLIAASPYFAAMLSDRWQERVGDDGAQEGRHLTATYLPNHDFEVVLCFLYFCYTHELSLSLGHSAPSQGASECDNISHELTLRTPDSVCPKCQQARTAIRLCAAAEEWIVPDLQQQCWQYVKGVQQRLPAECRDVLLCDMAQLHQWDLAAQCT